MYKFQKYAQEELTSFALTSKVRMHIFLLFTALQTLKFVIFFKAIEFKAVWHSDPMRLDPQHDLKQCTGSVFKEVWKMDPQNLCRLLL